MIAYLPDARVQSCPQKSRRLSPMLHAQNHSVGREKGEMPHAKRLLPLRIVV